LPLLEAFAATTTAAIQNARLHRKVQELAVTDTLTGLFNRRGFYELGQHEIARFRRTGNPLSMIMIDIDHFKSVNDTYGHSFGDEVLKSLMQNCAANIRKMDIACR
jgi:diguanylate cyclase (GGDEF)-like protein